MPTTTTTGAPVVLGRDCNALDRNIFEAFMLTDRTPMMAAIHAAIRLGQAVQRGDEDNAQAWEESLMRHLLRG